jgi:hypothetical protein
MSGLPRGDRVYILTKTKSGVLQHPDERGVKKILTLVAEPTKDHGLDTTATSVFPALIHLIFEHPNQLMNLLPILAEALDTEPVDFCIPQSSFSELAQCFQGGD